MMLDIFGSLSLGICMFWWWWSGNNNLGNSTQWGINKGHCYVTPKMCIVFLKEKVLTSF